MLTINYRVVVALFLFSIASLACTLSLGDNGRTSSTTPIPYETVENLENQVVETLENSKQGEDISLTFTEAQLTSIIIKELEKNPDPLLQEPQVTLKDGLINVTGRISGGLITGNVNIDINPTVDDQGNPDFIISSASIGSMPIPDFILDRFSAALDNGLSESLKPDATGIFIEDIRIEAGIMTITGRKH